MPVTTMTMLREGWILLLLYFSQGGWGGGMKAPFNQQGASSCSHKYESRAASLLENVKASDSHVFLAANVCGSCLVTMTISIVSNNKEILNQFRLKNQAHCELLWLTKSHNMCV